MPSVVVTLYPEPITASLLALILVFALDPDGPRIAPAPASV